MAEHANHLGGEDLSWPRQGLQPGRFDHGNTAAVSAVVDGDLAHGQPDPHLKGRHCNIADAVVDDGPLDRDRSSDSIGRGGERCFDTIAREAGDRATVGIDNGRQQCIVVRSQQIGPVVADPGAKCRRIHHVREQDRSGAHSRSHGVRH